MNLKSFYNLNKEKNLIEKNSEVFEIFKKEMYNYYNPQKGFVDYISDRWLKKI